VRSTRPIAADVDTVALVNAALRQAEFRDRLVDGKIAEGRRIQEIRTSSRRNRKRVYATDGVR
jgi:hypothetical protein